MKSERVAEAMAAVQAAEANLAKVVREVLPVGTKVVIKVGRGSIDCTVEGHYSDSVQLANVKNGARFNRKVETIELRI